MFLARGAQSFHCFYEEQFLVWNFNSVVTKKGGWQRVVYIKGIFQQFTKADISYILMPRIGKTIKNAGSCALHFIMNLTYNMILCPCSHLYQLITALSVHVTVLHQRRSHGWSERRKCSSGSSTTST